MNVLGLASRLALAAALLLALLVVAAPAEGEARRRGPRAKTLKSQAKTPKPEIRNAKRARRAKRAKPFFRMSPREAACTLDAIHHETADFHARLIAISRHFVGTPYVLDPLGEGRHGRFDRDPLFSLTRVDCQTLVETIIAMGHARHFDAARAVLSRLRYASGKVDYRHRHHFPTSQWIPQNQKLGALRDVTATIAPGVKLRVLKVRVGPKSWRGKHRKWRRLGDAAPRGSFELPVLPLNAAIRYAERFPAGALLNVVRIPRRGYPEPISHQGFIAIDKGRRVVRQATDIGKRRVMQMGLGRYLRHCRSYYRRAYRPMLGVNVQLLVQSTTLSALAKRTASSSPKPTCAPTTKAPKKTATRSAPRSAVAPRGKPRARR